MDSQDLSEERVLQLLREAEERLSGSAQTMVVAPQQVSLSARDARYVLQYRRIVDLTLTVCSISSSSSLPPMYVKTTAGGARVDREFLITSNDRKLASNPRSVEDPIAARAASLNVSLLVVHALSITFMRKIYPKDISTRNSGPVLGPSLHKMRAAHSAYS